MQLKDIMTNEVEVVPPDCTVKEAAEKMDRMNIGSLPVCDGDRLVGMVTDRDVTCRVVAKGKNPIQVTCSEIMTSPIIYCYDDVSIEEAARLMEVKQIRRLAVIDRSKRLVGIVALGDFATKSDETLAGEALEKISEPTRGQAA